MKLIKYIILTLGIVAGLSMTLMPTSVAAFDPFANVCPVGSTSPVCETVTLESSFKKIVNTLLYVLGAVAVLMIILGGITYVTSAGDAAHVTKAKNTILYSVVGLVVAILAYAIVNFVLGIF